MPTKSNPKPAPAAKKSTAKVDPNALSKKLHTTVYSAGRLSAAALARALDLLEHGADPTYRGDDANRTPVMFQLSFAANQQVSLQILEAMVAKQPALRAEPDKLGRWPLHVALWYGRHPPFWDKLVELGNPIAPTDTRGVTPMFDAIKRDNEKGVQWLLSKGATLDGALDFAKARDNYCSDKMIAFLEKLLAK